MENIDVKDEIKNLEELGLGYERIKLIQGTTFRDCSTIILIPTRGKLHWKFVNSFHNLLPLMNQKRAVVFCVGDEVGIAYNNMIKNILKDPNLNNWKYILTIEDDNIIVPDLHIKLVESIEKTGADAVSGMYFTKGEYNMPQAYGDPDHFRKTGILDFKPRDVRDLLNKESLVEVNGIAMGCSLYRMDLFREISEPWFVTVQEWSYDKGASLGTQDLSFCSKARRLGKTFYVDCSLKVGHLDVNTGIVY